MGRYQKEFLPGELTVFRSDEDIVGRPVADTFEDENGCKFVASEIADQEMNDFPEHRRIVFPQSTLERAAQAFTELGRSMLQFCGIAKRVLRRDRHIEQSPRSQRGRKIYHPKPCKKEKRHDGR